MIDRMFDDCGKIARQYQKSISDVVIDFTMIEIQLKDQLPKKELYRTAIKQLRYEYKQHEKHILV